MKTGKSVSTFVYIEMMDDRKWLYCHNPIYPDHEFRYNTFEEAHADAEEIAKVFKGKQLFLIKETRHILTSIKYDGKSFNRLQGLEGV